MQHSCAMNTQCMQHVFNCIFVQEEGWNFGNNHELLCSCQTSDGNSCIFGWTQVKYSCTIGWAEFLYCYVSLEVPYWNLKLSRQKLGAMVWAWMRLKLRWLNQPLIFFLQWHEQCFVHMPQTSADSNSNSIFSMCGNTNVTPAVHMVAMVTSYFISLNF